METIVKSIRPQDIVVFKQAAQLSKCWILVRPINEACFMLMDNKNCVPKPINVKFKTADYAGNVNGKKHNIAGLVASPEFVSNIFADSKKSEKWKEYASSYGLHKKDLDPKGNSKISNFSIDVNPGSEFYGCVKIERQFYIYGDYDLFDIVRIGHERRNLYLVGGTLRGEPHNYGSKLSEVMNYVNASIRLEMIHHGGAAQYDNDFGDAGIYTFSPHAKHADLYQIWDPGKVVRQYADWRRGFAGESLDDIAESRKNHGMF